MAFWGQSHSDKADLIKDPKRKFRFMVQFTGFSDFVVSDAQVAGQESNEIWFAKTADKPSFTIATAEHKYLNHTFYYPGSVTWNEISVTMVDPQNPEVAGSLSNLMEKMKYQPPKDLSKRTTISKWSAASSLGNVLISQLDADGVQIEQWTLWNGFVTEMSFGNLEYGSDELNELTLKFRYDWAQLTTTDSAGTETQFFD